MNDLDAVLRSVREEFEPSHADRARVKQRLLARATGVGLMASLVTKGAAGTTSSGSLLGGHSLAALTKLFVGSMLVTFAGAGVVVAVTRGGASHTGTASVAGTPFVATTAVPARRTPPPSPVVLSAPAPSAALPVEHSASAVGALGALPRAPEATPNAAPNTVPNGARLEAELAILREARVATSSGNVERARRLLDVLDRDHPDGVLLEERAALRAVTECTAAGAATGRSSAFLQRYPASVYAARVRNACHLESKPSPGATASFTEAP